MTTQRNCQFFCFQETPKITNEVAHISLHSHNGLGNNLFVPTLNLDSRNHSFPRPSGLGKSPGSCRNVRSTIVRSLKHWKWKCSRCSFKQMKKKKNVDFPANTQKRQHKGLPPSQYSGCHASKHG